MWKRPSLNDRQKWGRAAKGRMVCHGFAISLSCTTAAERWILSATALCIIRCCLRPAHTHNSTGALPFPPFTILGADNGDLGWPDYPTLPLVRVAGHQSWEQKYMWWTLETQWTQDTRPNPPQPFFIGPLQKGVEKHLNTGCGKYILTHIETQYLMNRVILTIHKYSAVW